MIRVFNQLSWFLLGRGELLTLRSSSYFLPLVFFFYCCVTNYYTLSSLKYQKFIISQFSWVGNLVSSNWNQVAGGFLTLSEVQCPLPSSRVMGRDHCLAVVGLRSPIPCWLLAGGCSQLLETSCPQVPSHHGSLHQRNYVHQSFTNKVRPLKLNWPTKPLHFWQIM